jgi:hypothetical protein
MPLHQQYHKTEIKMATQPLADRLRPTNFDQVCGQKHLVGENGILTTAKAEASDTFAGSGDMEWQIVKVYNMPDFQRGVKIMRIK